MAHTTSATRQYEYSWKSEYYGTGTLPESCYTPACLTSGYGMSISAAWGLQCHNKYPENPPHHDCYPWAESTPYNWQGGFFSPATKCPSGWVPMNTRTTAWAGEVTSQVFLKGETAIECCPERYTRTESLRDCLYTDPDPRSWIVTTCGVPTAGSVTTTTTQTLTWTPSTYESRQVNSIRVHADRLQIRFRSVDLTSATSTSGAGGKPSGLSSGAKIGIGVAVPCFALLTLLLSVFLTLHYRRKCKGKAAKPGSGRDDELRSDEKETVGSAHSVFGQYNADVGEPRPTEEGQEPTYTIARPVSADYDSVPTVHTRPAESDVSTYPDTDTVVSSYRNRL